MTRVCSWLVGVVLVAQAVSAQPPPTVFIDMPAGQGASLPQLAPRDNARPAKAGTATLRGRVVAADSGQPLSGSHRSASRCANPRTSLSSGFRGKDLGQERIVGR